MTRDRYTTRFAKFLDSIDSEEQNKIPKNTVLEDRARDFARKATVDFSWAFAHILKFVQRLKERGCTPLSFLMAV